MSSCLGRNLKDDPRYRKKASAGLNWVVSSPSISDRTESIHACNRALRNWMARDQRTFEISAGEILRDLINSSSIEAEEELERKILDFPVVDLFLAGIENGSDEAISKSRYLMRRSENSIWEAWGLLADNLDIYPAVDYISDLSVSNVDFEDIALNVFLKIAEHNDPEVQQLLLEHIDEIFKAFRRPILIKLVKSIHSDISVEAKEILVAHGAS